MHKRLCTAILSVDDAFGGTYVVSAEQDNVDRRGGASTAILSAAEGSSMASIASCVVTSSSY